GFAKTDTRSGALKAASAYREAMAGFAQMGTLAICHPHLDEDEVMPGVRRTAAEAAKTTKGKKAKGEKKAAMRAEKTAEKTAAKAGTRDSLQALSKLGEIVDCRVLS